MRNEIIKNSRNTTNAPTNYLATQSVAFSHYNNISAQLPIDHLTGHIVSGDVTVQAKKCLDNIKAIIESIDHVMDDVVKMTIFVKDIDDIELIDSVYSAYFLGALPTRTVVEVSALPNSDALLQIEALISNGEGTAPQEPCALVKVSTNTENAPAGLSSQSAAFSHYNNLSAQLPLDVKTGELVTGGVKEQATQCFENIRLILGCMGHAMHDIVKTTIYLTNLEHADVVNEVCNQFFPGYVPARTLVCANALPFGALVQIDTSVSHGDGTPPQLPEDTQLIVIEATNTVNAPQSSYSHSVAFSHYNHISGQLPIDSQTNQVVQGTIKEQAKRCLENIKTIVESVNHVMDDTVKVNIQLKNIEDIEVIDEIYASFFNGELPARTIIGVSSIPMNALIQIDATISNCEGTPPQIL